jgi:hypothetical protein
MPAAIAVPAIISAAGIGYDAYKSSKDRKEAEKQRQQRGINEEQTNQLFDQFMQGGLSPEQLMQYLSVGPGGSSIASWESPDISPYLSPDQALIAAYQKRTPQEQEALLKMLASGDASMSQAGELGSLSMPNLQAVSDYNKALLGGDKAAAARAIAPEAEALAEQQQGSRRAIEASGLRGGARDTALAESMRLAHGQAGTLIPSAIREARTSAQNLGTSTAQLAQSGVGQAASIYGAGEGAERANRQFGIGAEQSNRQMGLQGLLSLSGLNLQNRGQDMGWGANLLQAIMQGRGQDLQAILGKMGVDTTRQGQVDSNYFGNRQLSNQYGQGLGQGAAGFWNLIQQQQKKKAGGAGIWSGGTYLGE